MYKREGDDAPRTGARIHKVKNSRRDPPAPRLSHLLYYLESADPSKIWPYTNILRAMIIQGLNIFLGHFRKIAKDIAAVGPHKVFYIRWEQIKIRNLGQGVNAMRGFFSGVRLTTGRILVNVNVHHAAFHDEQPLASLVESLRMVDGFSLCNCTSSSKISECT